MRRKDRQVTDPQKIAEIFRTAECCRLGLVENGIAYIVPLSFGFVKENGKYTLYFHSSPKGRKIDLIRQNGVASFEIEANCGLKPGEQACDFSYYYQCVIGHGVVSVLTDDQEKLHALRCVMAHYTQREDWDVKPEALSAVACIRLEIEELSAKEYQPQK